MLNQLSVQGLVYFRNKHPKKIFTVSKISQDEQGWVRRLESDENAPRP